MNKELEALHEMYNWIYCNCGTTYEDDVKLDKILKTVESALKRLEEIDNSNPSEALKGLKHIKKYYVPEPCTATTYEYLEIIEQVLLKAQEQEKVLEIIKEKCLTNCNLALVKDNLSYKNYIKEFMKRTFDTVVIKINLNDKGLLNSLELLTEEEFESLKRWVE